MQTLTEGETELLKDIITDLQGIHNLIKLGHRDRDAALRDLIQESGNLELLITHLRRN